MSKSKRNTPKEPKLAKSSAALVAGSRGKTSGAVWIQIAVVVVIVGVIAGLVGWRIVQKKKSETPAPTPAAMVDGAFRVGDPHATKVLTVVEDFQCPACKQFEDMAGPLLTDLSKQPGVAIDYRPLSFLDQNSTTNYSSRALNAAYCVIDKDPSKFPAFHSALFAKQPPEGSAGLSNDELINIAAEAGVNKDAISSCVKDKTYRVNIEQVTDNAQKTGYFGTPIVHTPTIFGPNGKEIQQPTADSIKAALQ